MDEDEDEDEDEAEVRFEEAKLPCCAGGGGAPAIGTGGNAGVYASNPANALTSSAEIGHKAVSGQTAKNSINTNFGK